MKRVFIAINFPNSIREEIKNKQDELKGLFNEDVVKWVKKENLHITVSFLGSLKEEDVDILIHKIEKIKEKPLSLNIEDVSYIPEERRDAKMIWARVYGDDFFTFYEKIDSVLADFFNRKKINFSEVTPHITLGRIKRWQWQKVPIVEIPIIEDFMGLEFRATSFDVIESKISRRGPDYNLIKKINLYE